MVKERHFGLIGRHISHSFSAPYFTEKFARENLLHKYTPYDLDNPGCLLEVIENDPLLEGLNVTSPYKRDVIPMMSELSEDAEIMQSVNVIKIFRNPGQTPVLKGYNTDAEGFRQTLKDFALQGIKALVFGTGGASSAVTHALEKEGIPYLIVSRKPVENQIDYATANSLLQDYRLLINATPVGMHPHTDDCIPIDYDKVTPRHIAYDLIYNPAETLFLRRAKSKGATIKNGLEMLVNQAELSWEIWK